MQLRGEAQKILISAIVAFVSVYTPAAAAETESGPPTLGDKADPFAGLDIAPRDNPHETAGASHSFLSDNFTFKKEIESQFSYGPRIDAAESNRDRWYSRQSAGFEVLKKVSSQTSTIASFDFQGRLVRRDYFIPVLDDAEGYGREGWYPEYHNAYLDLYNVLNPLLSDSERSTAAGHFNVRVGRFYLPFGINQQTDTHGTVLQLSNERNFGFERDWFAGLWGSLNRSLNYDFYYALGSGYEPSFQGQDGLIGGRVSLSNTYRDEVGLEGGISILAGQRRSDHAIDRSAVVARAASNAKFIQTQRIGIDMRLSHLLGPGSLSGTIEASVGKDESEPVDTQLFQLDYLHQSRKWGVGSQVRRFHQDFAREDFHSGDNADTSLIGEATWFFRNDIGGANLHWIKLNVERQLEKMDGRRGTITTIQYYRYW